MQVVPTELVLKPGESVQFRARLFDNKGHFLREEKAAWSLEQLKGAVSEGGQFTAATDAVAQAGNVKATVGEVSGVARVRVIPPLPLSENFDSFAPKTVPTHWINTTGKYEVREIEGNKVLVKLADNPCHQTRARLPGLFRYEGVHGRGRRARYGEAPPDGRRAA